MNLPTTFDKPVKLGIIGGTGLYKLDSLKPVAHLHIDTPWGKPSNHVIISETPKGHFVAFLSRHGAHHEYTPTSVPAQANIAALKSLGVQVIVAFSAVGSLQEEIGPRDFVLPNQIIDRTKGIRPSTFYGQGFVAHAGFGDPFDNELHDFIAQHTDNLIEGEFDGKKLEFHTPKKAGKDLTIICMEGPAFSTRAESRMYRSWGGSVINMSVLPEAKLAKEAEIAYQMICMSTDYDAWREGEEAVTVEKVVANLTTNSGNAHNVCLKILDPIVEEIEKGGFASLKGTMKYCVSTTPHGRTEEMIKKLEYLHPGYYTPATN